MEIFNQQRALRRNLSSSRTVLNLPILINYDNKFSATAELYLSMLLSYPGAAVAWYERLPVVLSASRR